MINIEDFETPEDFIGWNVQILKLLGQDPFDKGLPRFYIIKLVNTYTQLEDYVMVAILRLGNTNKYKWTIIAKFVSDTNELIYEDTIGNTKGDYYDKVLEEIKGRIFAIPRPDPDMGGPPIENFSEN